MVRKYTSKELLDRCRSLPNFNGFPNSKWIIGVRSKEDKPNSMDDKFYLFDRTRFDGVVSTGTTNPGTPVLMGGFRKYTSKGSFVLKSDYWHYDFWKPGFHRKIRKALVQVGIAVGYRDGNMNNKSEEIGEEVIGWFGINFHFRGKDMFTRVILWTIGWWSAGCQVPNNPEKYREIIEKTENQERVTYCLLKEF